jgi:oligopeptide/dipeptide ABC transporter ATP-binding protein
VSSPLLCARDLRVTFTSHRRQIEAVRGVSFEIAPQECLAVVGESGSGKTQMFLAALGLLPANARAEGGIHFDGLNLLNGSSAQLNQVRGTSISMIFQDPMTALTPHLRIGTQMIEGLTAHTERRSSEARAAAERMLAAVGVSEPSRRLSQYPHELSGGQRQRVLIGMSLLSNPKLLIADEPTTALDTLTQVQILALLRDMRRQYGMALVLISHDLSVVAKIADRVLVMYAGRVIEQAPATVLLEKPRHPYTAELIRCMPRLLASPPARMPTIDGNPPRPEDAEQGCAFAPRCPRAAARCRSERPLLSAVGASSAACHFPLGP